MPQVEHAAAVAMAEGPERFGGAETGLALAAAAAELAGGGRFLATFHDAGGITVRFFGPRWALWCRCGSLSAPAVL